MSARSPACPLPYRTCARPTPSSRPHDVRGSSRGARVHPARHGRCVLVRSITFDETSASAVGVTVSDETGELEGTIDRKCADPGPDHAAAMPRHARRARPRSRHATLPPPEPHPATPPSGFSTPTLGWSARARRSRCALCRSSRSRATHTTRCSSLMRSCSSSARLDRGGSDACATRSTMWRRRSRSSSRRQTVAPTRAGARAGAFAPARRRAQSTPAAVSSAHLAGGCRAAAHRRDRARAAFARHPPQRPRPRPPPRQRAAFAREAVVARVARHHRSLSRTGHRSSRSASL